MTEKGILIRGARQHNLKNITLELPRNRLIVITGVSGSGKSSLAFDTLYAEGQRRYIESLSAYARQFLGQMDKPDVDFIEGLSPAIAIEQRSGSQNPRSTVGTTTETNDYLRLLFARIGIPHCPTHKVEISAQGLDAILNSILQNFDGKRMDLLAPMVKEKKGEHKDVLERLKKEGYTRIVVDGVEVKWPGTNINLEKTKKHSVDVVVDTIAVSESERERLAEGVELCQKLSGGMVIFRSPDGARTPYSASQSCPECGFSMGELEPRTFSFNNPYGACPECSGIGATLHADPDLIIPNKAKPLTRAITVWGLTPGLDELRRFGDAFGYDPEKPVSELSDKGWDALMHGWRPQDGRARNWHWWDGGWRREGLVGAVERRWKDTKSEGAKEYYMGVMTFTTCPSCKGKRLKPGALAVTVHGKTISDYGEMSVEEALRFFGQLDLNQHENAIVGRVIKEILARLGFLDSVGLGYITLDRASRTLSGGEAERIALATQIGSGLVGVLYILDEPSIGLHARDHARLLATLKKLRDLGNTVLVVEHDEATMRTADWIVDMGPGAGVHGGNVLFSGPPEEIGDAKDSLTGEYLSGRRSIPLPSSREKGTGKWIEVHGAKENNLKDLTVRIPLGTFTCISGVSGSGKSTLVEEIIYKALRRHFGSGKSPPGKHDFINGVDELDRVLFIDQSPIGRTPRSNPATYTGILTPVRELFCMLPEARARGYKPGRFSFNVPGGRCDACEGDGVLRYEMHFLPDVYVACESCKGKRFNQETLEILYKGKSIADVLKMTVEEALNFFSAHPRIANRLKLLSEVGLGYIELGQSATTLSGGEAQRIKIAYELAKVQTGRTLYLLDEPTTGLHFEDVKRLLEVLFRLRAGGNTVVVIEHNMDVLKSADYIIDLGPEGGEKGGELVAEGTPEELSKNPASYTAQFLLPHLREGVPVRSAHSSRANTPGNTMRVGQRTLPSIVSDSSSK
jgi:excinuclease ABC subunit A